MIIRKKEPKWCLKMHEQDDMEEGYLDDSLSCNSYIYGRVEKKDASIYISLYQVYQVLKDAKRLGYECSIRPKLTEEERESLFGC